MYVIEFTSTALRQFRKLPLWIQKRIQPHIDILAENPRPPGVKKLRGTPYSYRLGVGAYRVKYVIDDDQGIVTVVEVVHRRDAY